MDFNSLGRGLVLAGLGLVLLGGLIWLAGKFPGLQNLPGTLRFEGRGFTCIFPVLGSILISVVLTLLFNLLVRFFNR